MYKGLAWYTEKEQENSSGLKAVVERRGRGWWDNTIRRGQVPIPEMSQVQHLGLSPSGMRSQIKPPQWYKPDLKCRNISKTVVWSVIGEQGWKWKIKRQLLFRGLDWWRGNWWDVAYDFKSYSESITGRPGDWRDVEDKEKPVSGFSRPGYWDGVGTIHKQRIRQKKQFLVVVQRKGIISLQL